MTLPDRRSFASRRAALALLLSGATSVLFVDDASARRGRGGRDDDDHRHGSDDFNQARDAVQQGEALPLSDIMVEVRKVINGDILDVELLRNGPDITYRIRMLSANGSYHQIFVDAKTKTILKIEKQ